jgi:hypothetical protein
LVAGGVESSIAVDSTGVYWETTHAIMKVGLDGGTPVKLAATLGIPNSVAIDSASVYWADGFGSGVQKAGLNGGSPVTLASAPYSLEASKITVDAFNAYWVDDRGGLSIVSLSGGTPLVLHGAGAAALASDSATVFFASGNAGFMTPQGGTIKAVGVDGGVISTLVCGQLGPQAIAVDSTSVYWVNQATGHADGSVMKMEK